MRFTESLMALAAAAAVSFASKLPSDEDLVGTTLAARDASTDMSKLGPPNTDGKVSSARAWFVSCAVLAPFIGGQA